MIHETLAVEENERGLQIQSTLLCSCVIERILTSIMKINILFP